MATQNKYDRQLRLWGEHGQAQMNESTILLLGASSTGSETLKNLILPCIKKFVIVDDAKITERDLGQNFFMTEDDLGKCKAQVMMENLHELNPTDTQGAFIDMPVDKFIDHVGDAIWGD